MTKSDATRAAKRAKELASRRGERNENKERADTKYKPLHNIKQGRTKVDRYKYIYVSARNAEIKKEVFAKYASESGRADLNVFCIGNIDYDIEGDVRMDPEARDIAIKGCGIPELRCHCHSIVTRAQFRASNHFLEVEIPDLIQSLEVWVESAEQDSGPSVPPNRIPELQKVRWSNTHRQLLH